MSTLTPHRPTAADVAAAVAAATDRIAPTWPLDQFIAVNPYWGWRATAANEAAAHLGTLAGTRLTMPRSWYRSEWLAGRLDPTELGAAAGEAGAPELVRRAIAALERAEADLDEVPIQRMALVTDLRDLGTAPRPGQTWTELVVHQIGQHCAAHVDRWQGSWHPDQHAGVFESWLDQHTASHGVRWRQGAAWARGRLIELPTEPLDAIRLMLHVLDVEADGCEAYLTALALSVNGWAAWFSYERWQADLAGTDAIGSRDDLTGLLAIRLAWEWLLHGDAPAETSWTGWANSWSHADDLARDLAETQRIDWLLQRAVERTHQRRLVQGFRQTPNVPAPAPEVQAVFCIDVRSEVFRRALESVDPAVHTRGFAGFFGLPIAFTPGGSALTRPQLPGLLAPSQPVTEVPAPGAAVGDPGKVRSTRLRRRERWDRFRRSPSSMFTFVETAGLSYVPKLVHHHAPSDRRDRWEDTGLGAALSGQLRPHLELLDTDVAAATAIALRVLRVMGLTERLAPLVLLCGHGSTTTNNPHAAGLDCGACGGQTGEVNARVLAELLNDVLVRTQLRAEGIDLTDETWFVAGLHDTTTDDIELFDLAGLPEAHRARVERLQAWLAAAGDRARAERAPRLGLGELVGDRDALHDAVHERAHDWSQVRPEWGLAGNASFVVAPRRRTRHLDLGGRTFLHDYDWRLDDDRSVLTLIMTAPMVVTNWINLQYLASTVDHRRYGSGNKVLHNVVGGRVGVFEGNGGDLRIGLSSQSLHDGTELQHPPLRLSVFVEAPRASIDSIIGAHAVVRDLVVNEWLHLLRIEPSTGEVERWTALGWRNA